MAHTSISTALPALLLLTACAPRDTATAAPAQPAKAKVDYAWESPNGWKGGTFSLPPKPFAPALQFRGREVLRFAPGYYKGEAHDFWTYAFAFFIDDTSEPDPAFVDEQMRVYFRGLGSNLGDNRDDDLPAEAITILSPSTVAERDDGTAHYQLQIEAFDSWVNGDAITLNVQWETWPCSGSTHRALLFLVSPQPYTDAVWETLHAERPAIECGPPT